MRVEVRSQLHKMAFRLDDQKCLQKQKKTIAFIDKLLFCTVNTIVFKL